MIKKVFFIVLSLFLTACSTLQVLNLPVQQTDSRLFKVERLELDETRQVSLLSVQFEPEQWRWVQVDSLGAPIARLILTKSGWKNDGFVMPNKQAQELFSALATALNPNERLFEFSAVNETKSGRIYQINHKTRWIIKQNPPNYSISLPDESIWQIEELNQ